jgi:Presenilin
MPGLLYEASLSGQGTQHRSNNNSRRARQPQVNTFEAAAVVETPAAHSISHDIDLNDNNGIELTESGHVGQTTDGNAHDVAATLPPLTLLNEAVIVEDEEAIVRHEGNDVVVVDQVSSLAGRIPFALVKLYRLRLANDPQPHWITGAAPVEYTPEQLREVVQVSFSPSGGRIVPTVETDSARFYRDRDEETRYTVLSNRGEERRVVFVNSEGRIFQCYRKQNAAKERKERNNIKLGLGDFIFYSILVSKAALYSFTTFAVCTLAVLSGLGLTLLLLAIYGKALPALPISILFGVLYYFLTRYVIEPFVEDVFIQQVYA